MACDKIHYTRAKAKEALEKMKDSGRSEIRFYLCPECCCYHLTRQKTAGKPYKRKGRDKFIWRDEVP